LLERTDYGIKTEELSICILPIAEDRVIATTSITEDSKRISIIYGYELPTITPVSGRIVERRRYCCTENA
jgi:hypothetical protein